MVDNISGDFIMLPDVILLVKWVVGDQTNAKNW